MSITFRARSRVRGLARRSSSERDRSAGLGAAHHVRGGAAEWRVTVAALIVDPRHARRYWTCQLAGWFIYDGLWLLPGFYTGETIIPVGKVVLGCVIQSIIAIAWTHLYRHVIRKRGWVALGPGKLLPRVVAACVVVGVAISVSCIPIGLQIGRASCRERV